MFLTKASTIARNIWLCINLLFLKSDKSAKYKFPKLVIRVLIYPPLKLWNWLLSLLMNLRFSDPKKWTNKYLFQIIYSVWKYMFSLTSIISIYFFTPSRGYILLTSWFGSLCQRELRIQLEIRVFTPDIVNHKQQNDGHWRGPW